jgi:hypothetical protein
MEHTHMSMDTKVTQEQPVLSVRIERSSTTRHKCYFCGGYTDKYSNQARVYEGTTYTGHVACLDCLERSPVALKNAVQAYGLSLIEQGVQKVDASKRLPTLPSRADLEDAELEVEAEFLAELPEDERAKQIADYIRRLKHCPGDGADDECSF